MDGSNNEISNTRAGLRTLTAQTVRGKQDIESVIMNGIATVISSTEAGVQELTAQAVRGKQDIESVTIDGTYTIISNTKAGVQELTAQRDIVRGVIQSDLKAAKDDFLAQVGVTKREIRDFKTNDDEDSFSRELTAQPVRVKQDIIDSSNTILSNPEAGVQELQPQTKRGKNDIKSVIVGESNINIPNTKKCVYTLTAKANKLKQVILSDLKAVKKGHFSSSGRYKKGIRDFKTNADEDNYSPRKGVEHDDAECRVCTVSPILGIRWKCRECPNYDMCSSCFKDHRRMHGMSHSFIQIGTPRSLSTNEQQKEHEVQETPSLMQYDWAKMKRDEHVKTVHLEPSSKEFITVMGWFIQTLDNEIVNIISVQNQYLWEFYCVKRQQMENINGNIGANEKYLFHETKPDVIHTVCAHNLDMSVAGTNVGAMLGNGIYFASEAQMSDSYATPDPKTGHKFMLHCRVLVGRWTKGQPGLQRPPEVSRTSDGQVTLYDSCVDNVRHPSIFCIFDRVQYYPQYIIEYK